MTGAARAQGGPHLDADKGRRMTCAQPQPLTSRQVRFLRGRGHHLKPAVMVGRQGVTRDVLTALNASLAAHELVKVKLQQNCPLDRRRAAALLAERAPAALVQVLGRTVLLYRPNPDLPADRRIVLP